MVRAQVARVALDPRHPKQEFSCAVLAPGDGLLEARLRDLVAALSAARSWTIGPPEFARFGDDEESTFGVILDLYSAHPPWGARLPRDIDRTQFEEVSALVGALSDLSRKTGDEIECHLGDTYVGSIVSGKPDQLISEGLLGEWAKVLAG